MKSVIIKPQTEVLRQYIQYFLFFKKTDNDVLSYMTFPNSNLCLAIYKENDIQYINHSNQNSCIINQGKKNFTSRFYGFHKMPFSVDIKACFDQICIIFNPSALRAFTSESYDDLMISNDVFSIFKTKDEFILEQIFEEVDFSERANKLEHLLLKNLNYQQPEKLKEALFLISNDCNGNLNVELLAKKLKISKSTLFRLFKNYVGQSPKDYLKTIRFRKVLNEVLDKKQSLTRIAHLNQYYDQSHFINDFSTFSGYSPKQLLDQISIQQNELTWIYNKK